MDQTTFIARYGNIYEHSPWVAQAAWAQRTGDTPLADIMAVIVDAAGADRQRALLCAHPDLAGKLARANQLTPASQAEQAGAGLNACSAEELAEFQDLNTRYTAKFGFPFIFAVQGHHRTDILAAFRERIRHSPEQEFAEALKQVHRIARLRLAALEQTP